MEANRKYGKLTTIKEIQKRKYNPYKSAKWLCKCECGNEKEIFENNLRSGTSSSCGCKWIDKSLIYNSKEYAEKYRNKIKENIYINENNCWVWKRSKHKQGYGNIGYKGKHHLTHRVSWMVHKGEIPKGIKVCHTCDITSCCNPEHLFLGTQKVNCLDASLKGRLNNKKLGKRRNKLNFEQVKEIKKLNSKGITRKELEIKYEVGQTCIAKILTGRSWNVNWTKEL